MFQRITFGSLNNLSQFRPTLKITKGSLKFHFDFQYTFIKISNVFQTSNGSFTKPTLTNVSLCVVPGYHEGIFSAGLSIDATLIFFQSNI